MKKILITIILTSCLQPLFAQTQKEFKRVGTTGYVFLGIPMNARSVGMGEASLCLYDGALSVFDNPALIGVMKTEHAFGVSYADWFAETKHEGAAYAYNLQTYGSLAISALQLDYGEMQGTMNPDPQSTGSYIITNKFRASGSAFSLSYARAMTDRFSFGASVKYVQEKIAVYSSGNSVVDLGIFYNTGFNSLRLSGVMKNFGVDAKYLEGMFKMPTEFRLGAAMDVLGGGEQDDHSATLVIEAIHPSDAGERLHLGAEYWYQRFLAVRGGYKINYDEETWTMGGGVRWSLLGFDVAYAKYGRLGGVVRFSVGFVM